MLAALAAAATTTTRGATAVPTSPVRTRRAVLGQAWLRSCILQLDKQARRRVLSHNSRTLGGDGDSDSSAVMGCHLLLPAEPRSPRLSVLHRQLKPSLPSGSGASALRGVSTSTSTSQLAAGLGSLRLCDGWYLVSRRGHRLQPHMHHWHPSSPQRRPLQASAADAASGLQGSAATQPPVKGKTPVVKSATEAEAETDRQHPSDVRRAGPRGIPSRAEQLSRLQDASKVYDVLVIGGGATGSGIALDAASRGLEVALVERGDFASETSSRSTKLIWAGIRYMGTAVSALLSRRLLRHPVDAVREFCSEIVMVLHCHRERHYMMTTQKHLCEWVPIAVPIRSWTMDPPPMNHPLFAYFPVLAPVVFKVYDALSYFQCPPSYVMTRKQAQQAFPQLTNDEPDGKELKYCAVFYEAMHNDARTNLAIALTAAERGAVVANYVEAIDILKDGGAGATGAALRDAQTGQTWNLRARKVVLAAGPFTDDVRRLDLSSSSEGSSATSSVVQGSAGTHIVVPGYVLPKAKLGMLDPMTSDGRFLFILPWLGHTLIGTTDRKGPAVSLPAPPEADIDWILRESQTHLNLKLRRDQVLSAWTGWRPLAKDPNVAAEDGPISRDHVISENPETGVIFVAGGKWTTWRQMAEEVVDRIVGPRGPPCQTLAIKLHGGDGYTSDLPYQLLQTYSGLSEDVAQHLARTYGTRAWEVCELATVSGTPLWPQLGAPLVAGFPYIDAEVRYACREYAVTIEDVLSRRTRLAFLNKKAAVSAIPVVADLVASELGWTLAEKRKYMRSARLYLESYGGSVPESADVLLREASQESPQRLFVTLDRDGSGYIDYEEVSEAVSILGLTLSDEQLERLFERMDVSGKGRVSAEEFAAWWDKFRGSKAFDQLMSSLGDNKGGPRIDGAGSRGLDAR